MMGTIYARIGAILAAVVAAVAAIGAVFLAGKRSGTKDAALETAQQINEHAKGRADADSVANRESDPAERLRRDWSRD